MKIGSFTKSSRPTIPGKINGTCVASTIETGAEVSILRKEVLRAKDLRTGESMPIMSKAEVQICIGQLKIKHRALMANIENDFILGMDLINCHGLTVDPVHRRSFWSDNTDEERKSNLEIPALELGYLTHHQGNVAKDFLQKHNGMFASGESSGCTNIVRHRINTRDTQLIHQAARRLPLVKQQDPRNLYGKCCMTTL